MSTNYDKFHEHEPGKITYIPYANDTDSGALIGMLICAVSGAFVGSVLTWILVH